MTAYVNNLSYIIFLDTTKVMLEGEWLDLISQSAKERKSDWGMNHKQMKFEKLWQIMLQFQKDSPYISFSKGKRKLSTKRYLKNKHVPLQLENIISTWCHNFMTLECMLICAGICATPYTNIWDMTSTLLFLHTYLLKLCNLQRFILQRWPYLNQHSNSIR